jgi:predicted GIY-YIG superfamily endonuclease
MWYIYILECKDGSYYIGATDNLERRFLEYKYKKGGKFTKDHSVIKLVYSESHTCKDESYKRERQLKGWTREKKLKLINGEWGKL